LQQSWGNGIRISDAAAAAGVSPRTLRYCEVLGFLSPSLYTPGGERRSTESDLTQLRRILELREVLGMNLDEVKEFLSFETGVLRTDDRAKKDAPAPPSQARGVPGASPVSAGATPERTGPAMAPESARGKTAKFDGSCTAPGRKRKSERAWGRLHARHDSLLSPHSLRPAP